MSPQILPTHACFDDAAALVNARVAEDPALADTDSLILVHGIARASNGPYAGEAYAHAWVEVDGFCWDAGLLDGQRVYYAVPRDPYYAARGIQQATRYTMRQAALEDARTGTCGPWEPAYQALCGRGDRRTLGTLGEVPIVVAAPGGPDRA